MVARYPRCPACRRLAKAVGEARWQVLEAWFDGVVTARVPEPLLHGALYDLRNVISTDRASLVTPMPDDRLRVVASSDLRSTGDLVISLERYPELEAVLESGQPFLAEDVRSASILESVASSLERLGILSLMAVPVTLGDVPMIFRLVSTEKRYGEEEAQVALSAAHLLEHAASEPLPHGATGDAWKRLVAKLSDCVVEVRPNGQIASIEGKSAELFGRPASELEGTQAEDLFRTRHSSSPGRHLFRLLEILRESGGDSPIATVRTAGGRMARLSLTEVPGVIVPRVYMAIHLLKECELAMEDLPVPGLLLQDNTIVAANRRAARLLRAASPLARQELFRNGETTVTLNGASGGSKEFHILGQSRESQGDRLVLLVDAKPWTEAVNRVETLQAALARHMGALEAAQRHMEELEVLKSRFLASSAHELKTPLTVLQSYLEILSTDLAEGLSEEQRSFIDIAYRNVLRLRRLVLDLTDLAALEGGQIPVEIGRVAVMPVATGVVEDMQPIAKDAGLDLRVEIPAGIPDVRADASRVEQVLHNLVDNALKYTPAGGSVRVTARRSGDSVAVEIRDTGVGIPPGQEAAIFEPFVRSGTLNPDTRPEGSGLGLTISRRIMSALGGRLSVTSSPGEGSAFRVHLPIWPGAETNDE